MVKKCLDRGYTEIDTAYRYLEEDRRRFWGIISGPRSERRSILQPRSTLEAREDFSQNRSFNRWRRPLSACRPGGSICFISTAPIFKHRLKSRLTPVRSSSVRANSGTGLSNFASWQVADIWHICKRNGWVCRRPTRGDTMPLHAPWNRSCFPPEKLWNSILRVQPPGRRTAHRQIRRYTKIPEDGRFALEKNTGTAIGKPLISMPSKKSAPRADYTPFPCRKRHCAG